MKPRIKKAALTLLAAASVIAWAGNRENKALQWNEYTVHAVDIPREFSGFRIAQISDLHNMSFGEDNSLLISLLRGKKPDLIAVTGDLVDSRNPDLETAVRFVRQASEIAPVYYVPGNHEARLDYETVSRRLREAGAAVLHNEKVILEKNGSRVALIGLADPGFSNKSAFLENLEALSAGETQWTLLLSHRPEYFAEYASAGMDLVLSGHAHGGQFRVPFVGGIIAPGQGFFPKYDSGLYFDGETVMAVSRGLGNSLFPFRLGNPPEVLAVELISDEK